MGFFVTQPRPHQRDLLHAPEARRASPARRTSTSCARLCHAASTVGLKETLGWGAPTCSLKDSIGTDLLVLFGTDLANNQPVSTKYLHYAKKAGARIVVVNPFREPALERYWVPSVPRVGAVRHQADGRLLPGASGRRHRLPHRRAQGARRERRVGRAVRRRAHHGLGRAARAPARKLDWSEIVAESGVHEARDPERFAATLRKRADARSSSTRWASPSTASASRT